MIYSDQQTIIREYYMGFWAQCTLYQSHIFMLKTIFVSFFFHQFQHQCSSILIWPSLTLSKRFRSFFLAIWTECFCCCFALMCFVIVVAIVFDRCCLCSILSHVFLDAMMNLVLFIKSMGFLKLLLLPVFNSFLFRFFIFFFSLFFLLVSFFFCKYRGMSFNSSTSLNLLSKVERMKEKAVSHFECEREESGIKSQQKKTHIDFSIMRLLLLVCLC